MNNFLAISDLKASNRKRAYHMMAKAGVISRVELSHELGISGATILKIVDYFIENEVCFCEEVGDTYTSVGRKPVLLRFNPDFAHGIAIFAEGRYISVAVVNMSGEIRSIREFRVLDVWNFLLNNIYDVIAELIAEVKNCKPIVIGMALPAIINARAEDAVVAPLIGKIDGNTLINFEKSLEERFQIPVCVQNDVNVSAFGEYMNHYAMQTENMIYISVGTGVGCGIILGGKLLLGENNSAGEIGYMIFDDNTNYDRGNGGWLEEKINLKAIDKMMDGNLDTKDKRAEIIEFIAQKLSICITNIAALLDINTVVLDGVVVGDFGQRLITLVQEKCDKLCNHKLNIELCKSYKPGISGLSYISALPVIDQLMGGE